MIQCYGGRKSYLLKKLVKSKFGLSTTYVSEPIYVLIFYFPFQTEGSVGWWLLPREFPKGLAILPGASRSVCVTATAPRPTPPPTSVLATGKRTRVNVR